MPRDRVTEADLHTAYAADEARARELAKSRDCLIGHNEAPDDVRDVEADGKEAVYIMPDAGCC